jgi:hypothetical protein
MLCHIFTLQLSHAMAGSKSSTAVGGLHCAARPPQNYVGVCISWLCNRFPKREMAQGQSHTIKINVSTVYQEALGSRHSTAAPYVCAGSLVSTDMWLRIPYFCNMTMRHWLNDSRRFGVSLCLDLQGCSGPQIYETARNVLIARAGGFTSPRCQNEFVQPYCSVH